MTYLFALIVSLILAGVVFWVGQSSLNDDHIQLKARENKIHSVLTELHSVYNQSLVSPQKISQATWQADYEYYGEVPNLEGATISFHEDGEYEYFCLSFSESVYESVVDNLLVNNIKLNTNCNLIDGVGNKRTLIMVLNKPLN